MAGCTLPLHGYMNFVIFLTCGGAATRTEAAAFERSTVMLSALMAGILPVNDFVQIMRKFCAKMGMLIFG